MTLEDILEGIDEGEDLTGVRVDSKHPSAEALDAALAEGRFLVAKVLVLEMLGRRK